MTTQQAPASTAGPRDLRRRDIVTIPPFAGRSLSVRPLGPDFISASFLGPDFIGYSLLRTDFISSSLLGPISSVTPARGRVCVAPLPGITHRRGMDHHHDLLRRYARTS